MQKLKMSFFHLLESLFTCFLKDKTLHNHWDYAGFTVPYYNIPSNNRELQLFSYSLILQCYYNIPSNNRELQLKKWVSAIKIYYNIPSNNRELQQQLDQHLPLKNYNIPSNNRELQHIAKVNTQKIIITYQVITGNYSISCILYDFRTIITYQVITGNYSVEWRII